MVLIPPGGFAGFSQMMPASRIALTPGGNKGRPSGKRAKRTKGTKGTKRRKRMATKGRMKFGSPAWQKKYKVGKFAKKKK